MNASRDESLSALEEILQSPQFREAGRLRPLLKHLATLTLDGETGRLKESVLGREFFRRGTDYDPRLDPVVRVEARRLRQRLEEFYASGAASSPVRLHLPKGGYRVTFERAPARRRSLRMYWIAAAAVAVIATVILLRSSGRSATDGGPARVALLRGQYQMNMYSREGLLRAVDYFHQALRIRPDYAPALAALSQTYAVLSYYGELPPGVPFDISLTTADKAIAADRSLAEAHAVRGFALAFHQWRWADAETELTKAISLDPNSAISHLLYGVCVLLPQSRFDRSHEEFRRALSLDPNSSFGNFTYGFALLAAGRKDEAIAQYRRTLELGAIHPDMEWDYGMALGMAGRCAEAADAFRRSIRLGGSEDRELRGLEAYFSGDVEKARRDGPRVEKAAIEGQQNRIDAARLFSMLGDKERAFLWLQRAIDAREREVIWIRSDPRLAALRSDPRFPPLAARVGL